MRDFMDERQRKYNELLVVAYRSFSRPRSEFPLSVPWLPSCPGCSCSWCGRFCSGSHSTAGPTTVDESRGRAARPSFRLSCRHFSCVSNVAQWASVSSLLGRIGENLLEAEGVCGSLLVRLPGSRVRSQTSVGGGRSKVLRGRGGTCE